MATVKDDTSETKKDPFETAPVTHCSSSRSYGKWNVFLILHFFPPPPPFFGGVEEGQTVG